VFVLFRLSATPIGNPKQQQSLQLYRPTCTRRSPRQCFFKNCFAITTAEYCPATAPRPPPRDGQPVRGFFFHDGQRHACGAAGEWRTCAFRELYDSIQNMPMCVVQYCVFVWVCALKFFGLLYTCIIINTIITAIALQIVLNN